MLVLKIIFLKNYFNIFLNKNNFKKQLQSLPIHKIMYLLVFTGNAILHFLDGPYIEHH